MAATMVGLLPILCDSSIWRELRKSLEFAFAVSESVEKSKIRIGLRRACLFWPFLAENDKRSSLILTFWPETEEFVLLARVA